MALRKNDVIFLKGHVTTRHKPLKNRPNSAHVVILIRLKNSSFEIIFISS